MDTFREIIDESKAIAEKFHAMADTDERKRIANTMSLLIACSDILYEDMNRFRIEFGDTNFKRVGEQLDGADAELLVAKLLTLLEYSNDFDQYVKHTHGTKEERTATALESEAETEGVQEE